MMKSCLSLFGVFAFSLLSLTAELPTIPLAQQSVTAFQKSTEAAIKSGDFSAWADYLGKQLAEETGRAAFTGTPEQVKKIADHPVLSLALAQWRLLTFTGPDKVKTLATAEGLPFLTWLLSNREALHAYLGSGPLDQLGTAHGLEIWRDIFKADPQAREGLWLRVAAAVALAHTAPVKCIADGSEIDPLRRYQYFKNAQSSGLLFDSFSKAATWELRFVVNSWSRDEELAWVVAAVDPKNKTQEKIGEACWMVPYRLTNSKGVSVQNGPEYYEHKPVTLELMHTVGGVCGAISRFGTSSAQAFGVPAMPVGQPGHCAFLWKKDPQTWRTGNDISGWAGSTEHGGIYIHWGNRGSYVLLMEEAHRDPARFLASEQSRWLAALTTEPTKVSALLETAAKIQPCNGGAWLDLIEAHTKHKAAPAAWQSLATAMMKSLPDHPIPLSEFLARTEEHLNLTDYEARRRYLASACAAIANGNMEAQHACGQTAQTELVLRQARAVAPQAGKLLETYLNGEEPPATAPESKSLSAPQRDAIQALVEAAVSANAKRPDLENALTGRYLALMSSNPTALARALKFFSTLFEQAKANPDHKPAIALARRLILLAAKAEDLGAMEKYSSECTRLLSAK